jgi:hypothetical protein
MDFHDLRVEADERRQLEQGIVAALALAEMLAEARDPDHELVMVPSHRMVRDALNNLTVATLANLLPREDEEWRPLADAAE